MATPDLERDKLLEELTRDAEPAPEPGTLHIKDIIHRGDEDLPAPMVAQALESACWVFVYDTKTGERSIINRNMLAAQLDKRREDGSRIFTTVKPATPPARGTFKCLLHPTSPNRALYDRMGLPVCKKSNLTSEFQVMRHMQTRHRIEWQTIENERTRQEKNQEREFQQQLLERVSGKEPEKQGKAKQAQANN